MSNSMLSNMVKEWGASRSPLSGYGMDGGNYAQPRACGNCHKTSKTEKYKICRRCKQLKVPRSHPMYVHYCGKDCQEAHWKIHRFEHTKYENQHSRAGLRKKLGTKIEEESEDDMKEIPTLLEMDFKENPFIERQEVLDGLIDRIGGYGIVSVQEINDKWYAEIEDEEEADYVIKHGLEYESKGITYITYPKESYDF